MKAAIDRSFNKSRFSFAGEARALPVVALSMMLLVWCGSNWSSPPYSPDSWAYYELSESIWRNSYRLLGLRSYSYAADVPSGSFPPLWPALWSLVAALTGLGARAGLLVAFGCIAVLAIFSEAIGRQLSGVKWVGLAAAAGLFAMPAFTDEVDAARSIPLQMALISSLIWILLRRGPIDTARAAVMGVICGALILTRFDMLVFAIAFGLIVFFISRSFIATAAFGILLLATISPWVTMSWLSFRELFHSDSSFVAISVDPRTFVTDWYPPANHMATVWDDPAAWAAKVTHNVPLFLRSAVSSPGPLGQLALASAAAALVGSGNSARLKSSFRTADPSVRRFAATAAAILAPLPLYVVTGYFDARYLSLIFWYLLLAASGSAVVGWLPRAGREIVESRMMLVALGILLIGGSANVARGLSSPPQSTFPELQKFASIGTCLRQLGAHATDRVLFEDDTLAARWAAVRRQPTAMLPRNFTRPGISYNDKGKFLAEYNVRFMVGEPEVLEPIFKPFLQDPPLSCAAAVYRVSPAREANLSQQT